jgi:hypothetical protein
MQHGSCSTRKSGDFLISEYAEALGAEILLSTQTDCQYTIVQYGMGYLLIYFHPRIGLWLSRRLITVVN